MSMDETVGLMLALAFFSVSAGAVVAAVMVGRRSRTADIGARHADAWARWLAARWTLTRASMSFVAAFRALAADQRGSHVATLRHDEAQRARSAWCDAMREMDRAEADLVTWSIDPSIGRHLARFPRIAPDTLRAVINGASADVDRLARHLREDDDRAAQFVRHATTSVRPRRSVLRTWVTTASELAECIIRHWTAR